MRSEWLLVLLPVILAELPGKPLGSGSNPVTPKSLDDPNKNEMPLLNLKDYDPSQMAVCDDEISADDIYSALVILMIRVENELRDYALKHREANLEKVLGLHAQPQTLKTLYGPLSPISKLKKHEVTAKYIDQMDEISGKLSASAAAGFYDHRLMMRAVRLSMKMMANQLACRDIAFDIAVNRFAWPSKFTPVAEPPTDEAVSHEMGMGVVSGVAPKTKDPNDPGSVPFSRWSGTFMDPKPEKWPWNGWPWMANNDPPLMKDKDKGSQGDSTNYKIPNQ